MSQLKSQAQCPYCNKVYAKRSISRHLEGHLKKMELHDSKSAFHLRVEAGPFFLQLLMNSNSSLTTLDKFLRQIWLECCGHMSQFTVGGMWATEIGKSRKAKDVFSFNKKVFYTYDFGSSTGLEIKVIAEHPIAAKGSVQLLTRNNPLAFMCHRCHTKPAEEICTAHYGDEDGWFFCEDCMELHSEDCSDAADYAAMPVVNSPRMGTCGYTGGSIDLERDGVFQG